MPDGQPPLGGHAWIQARVIADGVIAVAYCLIPVAMLYFMRRRRDLPFPAVFLMFAAFFIAAASTQAVDLLSIWHSSSMLSTWVKGVTALISIATVWTLIRFMPQLLDLPSPALLRRLHKKLEQRVQARTADLYSSTLRLEREVQQRETAEAEIRRLNDSLQRRISEVQTLFDILPVGIGIAQDASCREVRTNRLFAEMLNLPRSPGASLSASPIVMPAVKALQNGRELTEAEFPMRRAARENQPVLNFEETIVSGDGRELHLMVNAIPLRDSKGDVSGCVATLQDMTSQKLAAQERLAFERRLQETQKLESLGVLAGGIAHDFNNLLTGIIGNASIARLDLPEGHASVRAALDNLERAAMRAADLCKQMLAYAGKGRFVIQPVSISKLVQETADLLSLSIGKRAALQLHLADGLPSLQGDSAQLRQVLLNLVINASEAIGDGGGAGVVTVRTSLLYATNEYLDGLAYSDQVVPGNYICLEVADNGPGMDKATLARVFDPFFTTKFTGRGLGLAAVLGIVRSHKGAVKVQSEPSRGTSFKLLLPVAASDSILTPSAAPFVVQKKSTRTILLVEDEEGVRSVAKRILNNAGFQVVIAEDGVSAVDIVRADQHRFDAVLLDLTMPNMDGEEAFRQMRQLQPDLRVLIMSGFSEQDITHRFQDQGVTGFIAKPFTATALVAQLTAHLASAE